MKIKSDNLFKDLGIDTTAAIRIFLTQAVDCTNPQLKDHGYKKINFTRTGFVNYDCSLFCKSPSNKCVTSTKTPLEKCDIRAKSP